MAGGGEGFVDCRLDGGEFCVGHAGEMEELGGRVCEGDVEVCRLTVGISGMLLTGDQLREGWEVSQ